jgi:hypothetical protein
MAGQTFHLVVCYVSFVRIRDRLRHWLRGPEGKRGSRDEQREHKGTENVSTHAWIVRN